MPATASGEIKTRIVRSTQKNGDIYVLERQTIYEPDKKRNRVLNSKLLSKIPKGTETPVPTRPKKPSFNKYNFPNSLDYMAVFLGLPRFFGMDTGASKIPSF
jgi:hypothetical protein